MVRKMRVYVIHGPNPDDEFDRGGWIYGIYATRELAESALLKIQKEFDEQLEAIRRLSHGGTDDYEDDTPWIGEYIVEGTSIRSSSRKSVGPAIKRATVHKVKNQKSGDNSESSEDVFYQVHTANEDGWTDYYEDDDETDDLEVAVAWLKRPDVVWGEISYEGEPVAHTEENPNYDPDYGGPRNIVVFEDGWGPFGRVKQSRNSKNVGRKASPSRKTTSAKKTTATKKTTVTKKAPAKKPTPVPKKKSVSKTTKVRGRR